MDIPVDTTTLVSSNSQPLYLQLTRYKSTTLTALKLWGCKLNRTMIPNNSADQGISTLQIPINSGGWGLLSELQDA